MVRDKVGRPQVSLVKQVHGRFTWKMAVKMGSEKQFTHKQCTDKSNQIINSHII